MNEKIIKEIEEAIDYNRTIRCHSLSSSYQDASRRSNDVLGKAKQVIVKATDNYNKGLEDAWELARKIYTSIVDGGLSHTDINDIFGCYFEDVTTKYTASDALSAYNDWLKEKEEEAAKPVLGDVVNIYVADTKKLAHKPRGIFLGEDDQGLLYLLLDEYSCPQRVNPQAFRLEKTGEHVDIQGMLDQIG